jgi:Pectate lyase superfamily protein
MARTLYGLDLASYSVDGTSGAPVPFAMFTVWDSRAAGSTVTDLESMAGAGVAQVTADSQGYIGFFGPDSFDGDLWLEGASAVRLLVRPADLTARIAALEATTIPGATDGITQGQGDLRYALIGSVTNKVTKGDLVVNVKDFGAAGDGTTNDTAAINSALAAVAAADGGTLLFPAGTYMTSGGHVVPAYTHIQGREPSSRYWGHNPTVSSPSACAIKLRSGSTASAMLVFDTDFTAGSVRNITLLGNNIGSGIHGMTFANPGGVNNIICENLAIIQFTGDGIRGRLFASRFHHLFVGGCQGWGMNCPDLTQWTDVWVTSSIFTECSSGCVNIDSTWASGEVHFLNCRLERSGWDNTDITHPLNTSAPGLRVKGNLINASFIGCSTDANSGHGFDFDCATGRSIHHIQLVGCRFNRDGFGTMASLGEFAALRIHGISASYIEKMSVVGCTTTEGHADDAGGEPAYAHPKYGLWAEYTTFLGITGGSVSPGHNTPFTHGTGDNYRPLIMTRIGDSSWTVLAAGDTSERGPAQTGSLWVNTEDGLLQTSFDGSTWTDIGP